MSKKTNKKLLDNYAIYVKNLEYYHDLYYTKHKKLTKREMWLVALTSSSFSELYEILTKLLSKEKVNKFMESVVIMSQDEVILKDWERRQLDELVEYTTIENAKKDGLKQGLEQGINQGLEQGINQGLEQGIREGISSRNIEIARNLVDMNMDISDIAKATGLSIEELKALMSEE